MALESVAARRRHHSRRSRRTSPRRLRSINEFPMPDRSFRLFPPDISHRGRHPLGTSDHPNSSREVPYRPGGRYDTPSTMRLSMRFRYYMLPGSFAMTACAPHFGLPREGTDPRVVVPAPSDSTVSISVPSPYGAVCIHEPQTIAESTSSIVRPGEVYPKATAGAHCFAQRQESPTGGFDGWLFFVEPGTAGTFRCRVESCTSPTVRLVDGGATSPGVVVTPVGE